jgi:hypothetical protein
MEMQKLADELKREMTEDSPVKKEEEEELGNFSNFDFVKDKRFSSSGSRALMDSNPADKAKEQ